MILNLRDDLMLKFVLIAGLFSAFIGSAYFTAETKMNHRSDLHFLKLGMTSEQIELTLGAPTSRHGQELTYILDDASELVISFRDTIVTSAKVKFLRPMPVQDSNLTLIQMDSNQTGTNPSFFYAGKPQEGLIYKISSEGLIESMTWVQPFSHGHSRPKNLQALLRDFKSHRTF